MVMVMVMMVVMVTSLGRVRGVEVVVGVVGVVQGRLPTYLVFFRRTTKTRKARCLNISIIVIPIILEFHVNTTATHPLVPIVQPFLLFLHLSVKSMISLSKLNKIVLPVVLTWPHTETRRLRRLPTLATSLVMNWPGDDHDVDDEDDGRW